MGKFGCTRPPECACVALMYDGCISVLICSKKKRQGSFRSARVPAYLVPFLVREYCHQMNVESRSEKIDCVRHRFSCQRARCICFVAIACMPQDLRCSPCFLPCSFFLTKEPTAKSVFALLSAKGFPLHFQNFSKCGEWSCMIPSFRSLCSILCCCGLCSIIRARTLVVSGAWIEKKWYGTHTYKPNGEWDLVAEDMMINFSESGHPYSVDPVLWNEEL